MAKAKGKPRRPIMNRAVIDSLAELAAMTPATDKTEAGLRYLRRLTQYELSADRLAEKAERSAAIQAVKRQTRHIGTKRGRPPRKASNAV